MSKSFLEHGQQALRLGLFNTDLRQEEEVRRWTLIDFTLQIQRLVCVAMGKFEMLTLGELALHQCTFSWDSRTIT